MARGPRRRFAALLISLVVAACSRSGAEPTPTTATPSTSSSSSVTTTSLPQTPTSAATDAIDAEVRVPAGEGPFPAIVLVHGGGWVTGGPAGIDPLADHLNDAGFLTVNTRYALATFDTPGFPDAVEDVACAVRFAASHPQGDGNVTVIGHSAGAHIGALVALTGDGYVGDCSIPGSGLPNGFIGLAGPYDVSRLGLAVTAFFGGGPAQVPEAWDAGNPQRLTDANPDLESLIMYGGDDGLVPDRFAIDFHAALEASGSVSTLELVEDARHNQVQDPDLVGDLIVTWLER